jgi:hypothetical protein
MPAQNEADIASSPDPDNSERSRAAEFGASSGKFRAAGILIRRELFHAARNYSRDEPITVQISIVPSDSLVGPQSAQGANEPGEIR